MHGGAIDDGAARPVASGTREILQHRVREYYDTTQVLYSNLWSSHGVHYGFWENGTRSRRDAIRNVDRCVARELGLPMGSRILDAGCGIGGTSLFLAEELHHEVVGITLSPEQLRRARRSARRCRAPLPPTFEIRDYLATGFHDASFDGVFGIESVCYAERKADFLREAFRILRPGGRVVVSDGFLSCTPVGQAQIDYQHFLDGLALVNLAQVDEFTSALAAAGFADIRCVDKGPQILPSARAIWRLSTLGVAICRLPCRLGIFPATWLGHGLAGVHQRPVFESGVFSYCVFSAQKPEDDSPAHR